MAQASAALWTLKTEKLNWTGKLYRRKTWEGEARPAL
jgi:hypothetical protein